MYNPDIWWFDGDWEHTAEQWEAEKLGVSGVQSIRRDLEQADANFVKLEASINQTTVAGERYSAQSQSEVDTEQF